MKIGLTYTGSEKKHLNYVNWLKGNDAIEVVELSYPKNNFPEGMPLAKELQSCDALVFSGGIDVHPSIYKNPKLDYENADEFDLKRDEFEIDAFKIAQEKKMPVLGICRGLQLINCILGGNLKQDLGELNKTHKGGPDKIHSINVEVNSLLENIVHIKNGNVNSAHHQAINELGQGLKINARAEDGTIEGVERNENGKPFLLAVQWHPERMEDKQSPLSKNIRNRFIEEIRKQS